MQIVGAIPRCYFSAFYCLYTGDGYGGKSPFWRSSCFTDAVGYQNLELGLNYNYAASTFVTIGKTKATMTLGDIGVNDAVTYQGTSIQLLTDGGATATIDDYEDLGTVDATYTYATTEVGAPSDGWYLFEDYGFEYPQNDKVLVMGQGYCIDCGDVGAALVFSGAVSKEETEIELGLNYNYTGNCSPKNITFGDITINENVTYQGTSIQFLTDGGATATVDDYEDLGVVDATYTYATEDVGAPSNGWYLFEDYGFEHPQNNLPIPAGQGFCIDCGDADATITIPAAL